MTMLKLLIISQCLLLAVQGRLHLTLGNIFSLWRRNHLPHRSLLLPGGHHLHGHQDLQVEHHLSCQNITSFVLQSFYTGRGFHRWIHLWKLPLRSALRKSRLLRDFWNLLSTLLSQLLLHTFLPERVKVFSIIVICSPSYCSESYSKKILSLIIPESRLFYTVSFNQKREERGGGVWLDISDCGYFPDGVREEGRPHQGYHPSPHDHHAALRGH